MFAQKVKHAENAGAVGAIIVDNIQDSRLVNDLWGFSKMIDALKLCPLALKIKHYFRWRAMARRRC